MPDATYPRNRPKFYAHRYCRLLTKTCAAQEIGHIAFCLCVTIAMLEDSKRYKGPVTFYNGQLLPLVGVAKWESLDSARNSAIAAGWLHYVPGGTRRPGLYWVTIPSELDDIPDSACDETPQGLYPVHGDNHGDNAGYNAGYNAGDNGGEPSTLFPKNPSPAPNGRKRPGEGMDFSDFQETWNNTPGVRKCIAANKGRVGAFKARMKESVFLDGWRTALAKFPLKCFASKPDGWQPDIDWFLRPNNVTSILEGKFDWTHSNGQHAEPQPACKDQEGIFQEL